MTDLEKQLAEALRHLVFATRHLSPCPGTLEMALEAIDSYESAQARAAPEASREVEPLTDEQIDAVTRDQWGPGTINAAHRAYARAIERKCAESWGVKLEEQG